MKRKHHTTYKGAAKRLGLPLIQELGQLIQRSTGWLTAIFPAHFDDFSPRQILGQVLQSKPLRKIPSQCFRFPYIRLGLEPAGFPMLQHLIEISVRVIHQVRIIFSPNHIIQ